MLDWDYLKLIFKDYQAPITIFGALLVSYVSHVFFKCREKAKRKSDIKEKKEIIYYSLMYLQGGLIKQSEVFADDFKRLEGQVNANDIKAFALHIKKTIYSPILYNISTEDYFNCFFDKKKYSKESVIKLNEFIDKISSSKDFAKMILDEQETINGAFDDFNNSLIDVVKFVNELGLEFNLNPTTFSEKFFQMFNILKSDNNFDSYIKKLDILIGEYTSGKLNNSDLTMEQFKRILNHQENIKILIHNLMYKKKLLFDFLRKINLNLIKFTLVVDYTIKIGYTSQKYVEFSNFFKGPTFDYEKYLEDISQIDTTGKII